jgi:hypothetical protein
MSVSRLSKFQAFISGHQYDFEIYEVSSYPIYPLLHLYVVMEGEDIIEVEYCMSELVDRE